MDEQGQLKALYENRFNSDRELQMKSGIWETLCRQFFQKYIKNTDVVADVGAGYCEFINNIQAGKKYALDLNPDVAEYASQDVEVLNKPIDELDRVLGKGSIDVFFMSNFLEHLDSKQQIMDVVDSLKKLLKSKGRIMILQPNIKFVKRGRYWDFFDHKIPITDQALTELAGILDLAVIENIPKFLPYTTKNAMPKNKKIIWLYLKLMPMSNYFFGEQSFLVLQKKD